MNNPDPIFTVGHSTRPIEEFLTLLKDAGIGCVVDVRRLPGSRAYPQYNADALADSLGGENIDYCHLEALDGRRSAGEVKGLPTSDFWRNASFARYAAWAQSEAFQEGFEALLELARTTRCVVMCSEAVWWRCHRRIIADQLLARSIPVKHIMAPGKVVAAELTRGACVIDEQVVYPAKVE